MKRITLVTLLGLVLLVPPAIANDDAATEKQAGGKPALLVIDIQNAYLPYMDEQEKEIALYMINAAIDLFREQGLPIIRVYHTDPEQGPPPGSEPFQFPESIHIRDDDPMVVKSYPSAFKQTELEKILREQGCDTVFLCGLSSVGCVLATYYDAKNLELTTFMVKDALISHRSDLTDSVEDFTDAVGFEAIRYMLMHAPH